MALVIPLFVLQAAFEQKFTVIEWKLQEMFDSIAENTNRDMSGDMLWGFFFTDSDRTNLERAAPFLEEMGYSVNCIYLADKEREDELDLWWLHVEKIETHSVDSLNRTNLILRKFAKKHGLDSYDGMDVGPIPDSR